MTDLTPEQCVAALTPEMRARADCDPDVMLLVALLDQYNIPPHRVTVAAVDELMGDGRSPGAPKTGARSPSTSGSAPSTPRHRSPNW